MLACVCVRVCCVSFY